MAKKYNPWTGFLEDTADKANDAMMFVQLRFGSGKIEGAKLDESEFRDYAEALPKKYNEKIVTLSKNGRAIATYTAHDEKTTIDKAIRNCDSNVKLVKTVAKKNGYAIHIVSGEYGERIVLTFPGENYNNPHMWLGSNTPSNMSKAQELLAVFGK